MKLFNYLSFKALHKTLYRFQCKHLPLAVDIIQKCTGRRKVSSGDQSDYVYVINPDIANTISSCIVKEWTGGYLFEANPGPGILSCYLLHNGVKHLRVFEKKDEFLSSLKALTEDYPSLDIVQQDLMLLPSFEFRKKSESSCPNYVKEFFESTFKSIAECPWENGTPFQVFSVIGSKKSHKFLTYLLAALPNRSTLFSYGRCDIFLLVNETQFMSMNALPKDNFAKYRWSTVLYNLFFEIKCLQKFLSNSQDFLLYGKSSKKIIQGDHYYLIKLTPKPDLYSMSQEKLFDFFYFVRTHLAKRSDLVIKSIEQYIPFCGPRLIKEGMNVFMRFGDLSPEEILQLFILISSWPEYQNCNLQASTHRFNKKKFDEDVNFTE